MSSNYEVKYNALRVTDLRQILKRRSIPSTGLNRKADIIAAIEADDNSMTQRASYTGGLSDQEALPLNGQITDANKEKKMIDRNERAKLLLWKRPVTTIQYFVLECIDLFKNYGVRVLKNWRLVLSLMLVTLCAIAAYNIDGSHQNSVLYIEKKFLWCAYWVGLGILSSVGLGTGLHTFVLYLGPHIAAVTLAAFECMSVDFPEPPYPTSIVCPESKEDVMSIWTIVGKVRVEAMMWGAGTAIGELPPYFMARAARLSGQEFDDEEFEELEELIQEQKTHPKDMHFLERMKLGVHKLVQRVGFVGILLCASIPNPLFDLAGITCGHFLVPFWTFFGATLIGKAVIKMHIQKLFVIFAFSEHHVEHLIGLLKYIPVFGNTLQVPFKEYLAKQKQKLHHKVGETIASDASWLSWIFEKVVLVMVLYFVVSIIHSMAQTYHKKLCKEKDGK